MNNPYVYWGTVAIVALALVALASYPIIGQLAICIYAFTAFWRLSSARVFQLAMVALGTMLVAILLGWSQAVSAFAAYAFLLFMAGVFVLMRELSRFAQALRKQQEGEDA